MSRCTDSLALTVDWNTNKKLHRLFDNTLKTTSSSLKFRTAVISREREEVRHLVRLARRCIYNRLRFSRTYEMTFISDWEEIKSQPVPESKAKHLIFLSSLSLSADTPANPFSFSFKHPGSSSEASFHPIYLKLFSGKSRIKKFLSLFYACSSSSITYPPTYRDYEKRSCISFGSRCIEIKMLHLQVHTALSHQSQFSLRHRTGGQQTSSGVVYV